MASNINPYDIDGTFPVAGQDNSSQGFRDNFTNIKNNFIYAQNEIDDLQSKAIVTSALDGQTITNDMAGTQIIRPQLRAWTESLYDHQFVSSSVTLDFTQANFHKLTTSGPVTLAFSNWPASTGSGALGYGVMRVWISLSDVSHIVTLPTSVSIGTSELSGFNTATNAITFDIAGNYVLDFSSIDGGNTYLIFDVTRNHSTFRDPSFYYNSTITPSLYLGFNSNSLPVAQGIETYDDSLNVAGGMNMISAGDLESADPNNHGMTYGEIPGYSVMAARGNLAQGNVQPVQNNDFIGYFDAMANVNASTSTNWSRLSSINFFAVGTNSITNGIGGNIGFFTKDDGVATTAQAMGINSDQSITMFGAASVAGAFQTNDKRVDTATMVKSFAGAGDNFVANSHVSGLIITSSSYSTVAIANVTLPPDPVHGQTFRITSVSPITLANVNTSDSTAIVWVQTDRFTSGNVSVDLWYNDPSSTWYAR
jgi:hypothetical protein